VNDLRRLHVEIAGLDESALQSAIRNTTGQVHDEGAIDLQVETLRQLAGDQDEQWVTLLRTCSATPDPRMDD